MEKQHLFVGFMLFGIVCFLIFDYSNFGVVCVMYGYEILKKLNNLSIEPSP